MARNPKDVCVSYYYHQLTTSLRFRGSFSDFFEIFKSGPGENLTYYTVSRVDADLFLKRLMPNNVTISAREGFKKVSKRFKLSCLWVNSTSFRPK